MAARARKSITITEIGTLMTIKIIVKVGFVLKCASSHKPPRTAARTINRVTHPT
jgi:hypothetical protein